MQELLNEASWLSYHRVMISVPLFDKVQTPVQVSHYFHYDKAFNVLVYCSVQFPQLCVLQSSCTSVFQRVHFMSAVPAKIVV